MKEIIEELVTVIGPLARIHVHSKDSLKLFIPVPASYEFIRQVLIRHGFRLDVHPSSIIITKQSHSSLESKDPRKKLVYKERFCVTTILYGSTTTFEELETLNKSSSTMRISISTNSNETILSLLTTGTAKNNYPKRETPKKQNSHLFRKYKKKYYQICDNKNCQ